MMQMLQGQCYLSSVHSGMSLSEGADMMQVCEQLPTTHIVCKVSTVRVN